MLHIQIPACRLITRVDWERILNVKWTLYQHAIYICGLDKGSGPELSHCKTHCYIPNIGQLHTSMQINHVSWWQSPQPHLIPAEGCIVDWERILNTNWRHYQHAIYICGLDNVSGLELIYCKPHCYRLNTYKLTPNSYHQLNFQTFFRILVKWKNKIMNHILKYNFHQIS